MSRVTIDEPTGVIKLDGVRTFPLGLSNPPPLGGTTAAGADAWKEVAAGGANLLRTGRGDWSATDIDAQLASERSRLDAAAAHGLHCWLYLGDLPNLPQGRPERPRPGSSCSSASCAL
jgi:hypothetical protein